MNNEDGKLKNKKLNEPNYQYLLFLVEGHIFELNQKIYKLQAKLKKAQQHADYLNYKLTGDYPIEKKLESFPACFGMYSKDCADANSCASCKFNFDCGEVTLQRQEAGEIDPGTIDTFRPNCLGNWQRDSKACKNCYFCWECTEKDKQDNFEKSSESLLNCSDCDFSYFPCNGHGRIMKCKNKNSSLCGKEVSSEKVCDCFVLKSE